jgi:hypothetical protein
MERWQPTGSTRVQSRSIMSHDSIAKSTAREIPQYPGIPESPLRSPKNEVVEEKKRRRSRVVVEACRRHTKRPSAPAMRVFCAIPSARPSVKASSTSLTKRSSQAARYKADRRGNKVGGRIPLATVRAALAAIACSVHSPSSDLPRRTTAHEPTAVLQSCRAESC